MVNRNLIRGLDLSEEQWQQELAPHWKARPPEEIDWGGERSRRQRDRRGAHPPRRRRVRAGRRGLQERRASSRGTSGRSTSRRPQSGQPIKVLHRGVRGRLRAGRRRPRHDHPQQAQGREDRGLAEGDGEPSTRTTWSPASSRRKIKGGLLVDIGVNVFLPASQVDIRRPADIGDYIGRTIQCLVLKIDEARRNIVVSRRALIEQERAEKKEQLMAELEVGQLRKGIVKNIADFGAFVDLGGIDGLLHITDMSWGRIDHPSEMVQIDQEIEVQVLHIDREKEKIALGMKQKRPARGRTSADKYPVGSRLQGTVVNVMSYGAFVKLEEGIEGLVHISEMSWTKRVSHPSELVQIGRRDRGRRARHQQGEAGDLAGHEADPGESLGPRGRPTTRRARSSRARSAT